ncbi:MAG: response regulator [Proteobacteria bacterium]|nr:response regulator [Pseudomonadota bacterium]
MTLSILLVDDESGIRKVLGISLADRGYDVYTASNAKQALKIHQEVRPDIVLSDIKMPGMSGIVLLQAIKTENPDTEVIMITGHGDIDLAIKSIQFEATDFITKPVNDDILDIALNRAKEKISHRKKIAEYTENLEQLVKEKSEKIIEMERLSAIGQTYEGLAVAMKGLSNLLDTGEAGYLNELPFFVAVYNKNLQLVSANQFYQTSICDQIGKSITEINQTAQKSGNSAVQETFQTGMAQKSEEKFLDQSGERLPVLVYTAPIRGNDGEITYVLELSADMTEVKKLRKELQSVRQQYKKLFDNAPCYISVQDKSLKIVEANQLFRNDFPYNDNLSCYQAYKKRSEPCDDCPVIKTFSDGNTHHLETTVTSKGGDAYDVLIRTAPLFDDAGNVERVMEMSTNVTEIKKLHEHLASLGLLVGSISHNMKGLLTGVDGGMYLANQGLSDNKPELLKEGWEIITSRIERIRKMVLDILYYAKKRELSLTSVDLKIFADDLFKGIEQKMAQDGIHIRKNLNAVAGEFEADVAVLTGALLNILENAIDAVKEDQSGREHEITIDIDGSDTEVCFRITDNGIGMNPEMMKNLFTLFYSSKKTKGTGIGLFVSEKIIQEHGGKIHVTSTQGEGSTFTVMIPRKHAYCK